MTDELERACLLLDIDSALVVKHEARGADYVILADYGIGGIKKYSVPIIELQYDEPKSLEDYTVIELREMADKMGLEIPYRALKTDIVAIIEIAEFSAQADEEE